MSKKKTITVVLIADENIGTGHLMRVNAILENFKDCYLTLVSNSLSTRVFPLCTNFDEFSMVDEFDELVTSTLCEEPDLVIIDDYYLDSEFEKELYPYTKVVVIDDLCNRPHQCHLLFDQDPSKSEDSYKPLVNTECKLCIGGDYNYIKDSFNHIKKTPSKSGKYRVLVNFGGSDPVHGCLSCTKAIVESKLYKKYDFTILCGLSNPNYEEIVKLTKGAPLIKVLKHTEDVPKLFSQTDLAIGACGGMFKERIIAKIPSINVEIADNQVGVGQFVTDNRLGNCLTVTKLSDAKSIDSALQDLIENFDTYQHNCEHTYKGKGLKNVVAEIRKLLESSGR